MKSVYFVDDEQSVLDGLRRMLRDLRSEWHMSFYTSAESALAAMCDAPPDVIVSDMRMPGMDGAKLLESVEARCPSTIRFVLSGHAEIEQLSRAMRSAHQILTKPCSAERLRAALASAGALSRTLNDRQLATAIGGLGALPSIPGVLCELTELLERPEVDQRVVSKAVAKDPALSVRILQVANSGFFGAKTRIENIDQAVVMIGGRMLRNLVIHVKIVESFPIASPSFSLEGFGQRVVAIASMARAIAPECVSSDDLRALAMNSEIGQLVLASRLGGRYEAVLGEAAGSCEPVADIERRVLGVTHAEVGAYLLALWGQPPENVDRVRLHHKPSACVGEKSLLGALHIAECLVDAHGSDAKFKAALDADLVADPAAAICLAKAEAFVGPADGRPVPR